MTSLGPEADPLNGKGFEIERRRERSCFLSPFLCGSRDPKVIAYVHLCVMLGASLLSFIVFAITAIANKDILFYVGLIGAILSLVPMPFLIFAILGLLRKRANTSIPLVVFLCFLGVSFTGLFVFFMIIMFGADTNMQLAVILFYGLSMAYLSHIIRVLLRVRLDTLEEMIRPSLLRN